MFKKGIACLVVMVLLVSGFYFIVRGGWELNEIIRQYQQGKEDKETLPSGKVKMKARKKLEKAVETSNIPALLEGIKDTIIAVNNDPFDPERWMILGKLYEKVYETLKKTKVYRLSDLKKKDDEKEYLFKAEEMYTKAKTLRPNSLNIHRLLVNVNSELKKRTEVAQYLNTLLFLHPGVGEYNRLGMEEGKDYLEAALEGVKKYINTSSGRKQKIYWDAAPYYSAAVFSFKLNRSKEGWTYIKRGEERCASNKKNHYYYRLADFFEKRKNWEASLKYLQKIKKRKPDYRRVETKIRRIKRKQKSKK